MKRLLCCLPLLLAFHTGVSSAADHCSTAEAYAAEAATDRLDSWGNVHLFFKQFRHCYDASIAEGANDKIQLLWANHWSDLPQMLSLTSKDPAFKSFIWQRMKDVDFPESDFATIIHNAKASCPTGGADFCRAFIAVAASREP
jgi:hypothetical protein